MDELAKVIQAIIRPRFTEDAQALSEARRIANAVRAYLESDEVVERVALFVTASELDDRSFLAHGWQDYPYRDSAMDLARAALNAAGGKQDG